MASLWDEHSPSPRDPPGLRSPRDARDSAACHDGIKISLSEMLQVSPVDRTGSMESVENGIEAISRMQPTLNPPTLQISFSLFLSGFWPSRHPSRNSNVHRPVVLCTVVLPQPR